MKRIELRNIKISHFKGIDQLELDFDSLSTPIEGRNGSGKTSIADAYAWCLWGTNMMNRTDFVVYPLDVHNKPNIDVMPSVEVCLSVNGQEVVFTRRLVSKYSRPTKDQPESVYKGSVMEYAVSGVPYKANDYKAKVEEVCEVDMFKMLSMPGYFNNLPTQEKRKRLQGIATIASDEVIAQPYPRVLEALEQNKSMIELRREQQAIVSKTQQLLDRIPARKDEKEQDRVVNVDFEKLRLREIEINKQLESIDRKLQNTSSANVEKQEKENSLRSELADVLSQMHELKISVSKERRLKVSNSEDMVYQIEQQLKTLVRENEMLNREIDSMENESRELNNDLDKYRSEWKSVDAERFDHKDQDICYAC